MRRALPAFLAVLLFVPQLPARTNRDWNNVKKLHPGTQVEIFLWRGDRLDGEVETVSDTGLRLAIDDYAGPRVGPSRDVDRTAIRSIVRVRHHNWPDAHKWLLSGALAGGAIGVTTGAITDVKNHDHQSRWFTDGFAGTALGFAASCGALFVILSVETAKNIHGSATRFVYEDDSNLPPNSGRQRAVPNRFK